MNRKIERARTNRIKMYGPKIDMDSDAKLSKKYLHEEYEKAVKVLEEMKKIETADSKRLRKQMEIVENLSPYKKI